MEESKERESLHPVVEKLRDGRDAYFAELAVQRKVTNIDPTVGIFVAIDGMTWREGEGDYLEVIEEPKIDDISSIPMREETLGTYNINNSVVVFTNANGRRFVGKANEESIQLLTDAGFSKKDQNVPFSMGEVPDDPNDFVHFAHSMTVAANKD